MAIIIGDIHGNIEAAEEFLSYRPQERHIALGDLVDSRDGRTYDQERACLGLLLASDAQLLWGNHDLAYLTERPWRPYSRYPETAFRALFHENRHRFHAALAADGWLLTHAGVAPQIGKLIPAKVVSGGVEAVADWLNAEFTRQFQVPVPGIVGVPRYGHGPLFGTPNCRGGEAHYGGIVWFDPEAEQSQPSPLWPQIFGHSPVPKPQRRRGWVIRNGRVADGEEWINLNAERGVWVYDTETDEIVQLR